MAGLREFYCGWNKPSHASQFKWLEYTFNTLFVGRISPVYSSSRHLCFNYLIDRFRTFLWQRLGKGPVI